MYLRKNIIFVSVITLSVVLSYLLIRKNVSIKFYNKTGQDIDSLVIGDTYIGHLSNNGSTEFLQFKEFHFDSGIPYENLTGNIHTNVFSQFYWSWCGTERYIKTNGSYTFDLKAKPGIDTVWMYLTNHNSDLFNSQ